ncbi:35 member B1 [Seminavis robusta]|uniref:35 member B1 n=1 Tax=Seminavis robusta TaxID=568900 RepID=A0A9N8EGA5_9STRA|nr:35 member B1 [Seminavis robusta]|eukprot:Sro1153_g247060.1 35 member B1 (500) ;mRNA; f:25127-26626
MEEKKSTVITAGGVIGGAAPAAVPAAKKVKKKKKKKGKSNRKGSSPAKDGHSNDQKQLLSAKAQNDSSKPMYLEFEDSKTNFSDDPLSAKGSGGAEWALRESNDIHLGPKRNSKKTSTMEDLYQNPTLQPTRSNELFWLFLCFMGIMASFVCYGILLEYTTSGGRKLHELSFLFVTSGLYTITAAAGRYVRDETPTTIPPARFAVLGLTSMGSTFCSVRSLRYVIYPIQVLAKSCKPVPVMIMGAFMGKKYPMRKYANVLLIVLGVALFMGGGSGGGKHKAPSAGSNSTATTEAAAETDVDASPNQFLGIALLFISLCFDGGTGAYEDKLMSVHSVGPFDLMYNIQLGKTILAGIGLLVLNQIHIFVQMCQEMGFLLVALGLSGALGQVFIFVTIAKFGALTCSIIGLARKVTTLVASIYIYGHALNGIQFTGLVVSVGAMVMNFWKKKEPKPEPLAEERDPLPEEMRQMLGEYKDEEAGPGDVELAPTPAPSSSGGAH